jgi:ribosome biogenesis GTPase / thiamine phosphate phosphatase
VAVEDNLAVDALVALGWNDDWARAFEPFRDGRLTPGRVAIPHRGALDVLTTDGEVRARVSARLRRDAQSTADYPTVGDWVALDLEAEPSPTIEAVLPRRTKFSRRTAGEGETAAREQVVAANVDVVFVVASLADEVKVRTLERYLTLAWESGARPVILLTKADLVEDAESVADEIAGIGSEVPVLTVSSRSGLGLEPVRAQLGAGVTGALLGPSGAGKSTLVNALVGDELLDTGALTDRGGGRHTTTRRQLVPLPGGGLLIDNPGMRELHLWLADVGLEEAFPDVVELEAQCRFADCRHDTEPGCAIRAALEDGRLDPERWRSYRALRDELAQLDERLARRSRRRRRS